MEYFLISLLTFIVSFLIFLVVFIINSKKIAKYSVKKHGKQLEEDFQKKKDKYDWELKSKIQKIKETELAMKAEVLEEVRKSRTEYQSQTNEQMEEYKRAKTSEAKQLINQEIQKLEEAYNKKMETLTNESVKKQEKAAEEIQKITNKLDELKSKEKAAINARIRQYEEQDQQEFYKIQITPEEIDEIKELEKILPKLKNESALRKAIFEIYYRNYIKDLISRITRGERVTGVYKITHLKSGKCYIGQSVDIANRFLQHCREGSGAGKGTNNKLYPIMQKEGIYSFKFEIIEETSKDELRDREKYWMEYFGAKVYGYSKN